MHIYNTYGPICGLVWPKSNTIFEFDKQFEYLQEILTNFLDPEKSIHAICFMITFALVWCCWHLCQLCSGLFSSLHMDMYTVLLYYSVPFMRWRVTEKWNRCYIRNAYCMYLLALIYVESIFIKCAVCVFPTSVVVRNAGIAVSQLYGNAFNSSSSSNIFILIRTVTEPSCEFLEFSFRQRSGRIVPATTHRFSFSICELSDWHLSRTFIERQTICFEMRCNEGDITPTPSRKQKVFLFKLIEIAFKIGWSTDMNEETIYWDLIW